MKDVYVQNAEVVTNEDLPEIDWDAELGGKSQPEKTSKEVVENQDQEDLPEIDWDKELAR